MKPQKSLMKQFGFKKEKDVNPEQVKSQNRILVGILIVAISMFSFFLIFISKWFILISLSLFIIGFIYLRKRARKHT